VKADYFVWSMEHDAWWRPNHCGYTNSLFDAGLYTKAQADEIVAGSRGRNERAVHASECAAQLKAAADRIEELLEVAGVAR
jgi:hypothetical protein